MDLKLSIDDAFDQSVGCHSNAGSFSDVSSAYNPFTPSSGCSTPLRRSTSAFDASFSSYTDSASFDLTPPSSAVSAQFPYDFKANTHQDMLFHGIPATPTKYNNNNNNNSVMLDVGLDAHHLNGQLTPPHGMNFLPFASLQPAPFDSPCHTLDGDDRETMDRLWSQISGEAPIDFSEPQQRLPSVYEPNVITRSHQNLASPSYRAQFAGSRRNVHMTDAQKKAAALQNAQRSPRLMNRPRPRRAKNASKSIPMCGPVKNIPLRQFYCDQGCTGKAYSRQEHLKRHFLTAHNPEKPVIPCKFCPKDKVKIFDRADNYRQHLELHAKPGRKGRVEYHSAAAKELTLLKAQIKRRSPPKARMRDSESGE